MSFFIQNVGFYTWKDIFSIVNRLANFYIVLVKNKINLYIL